MKIFLIGYMGSGKSTIGKLLAEKLKMAFIDLDNYIEQETGKTIPEIFETEGEEKFRALEHEYLKKLFGKDNAVISLGGGTPCFHNNIELINKNGTSVYIEMGMDALVKRLSKARLNDKVGQAKNKRPLIRDLNEVDLKYFIEMNLEKRRSIYEQASYYINASLLNTDKVVKEIRRKIMQ